MSVEKKQKFNDTCKDQEPVIKTACWISCVENNPELLKL